LTHELSFIVQAGLGLAGIWKERDMKEKKRRLFSKFFFDLQ